jgi:hypothetical protein
LQMRGINTYDEFSKRQRALMDSSS